MRPPETLTARSVDTSTTSKHSLSTVAKGQAREDDNAHIQSVPKHHQQVDELDISHPGFREVPSNVRRITAGTRSAAAPPSNQPQAAPLNRRRPLTRKSKKKNRPWDNSDSGSESDNTNRRGNNDNYSASRRPEGAPEVPEAVIPAEYHRQMRQKGFDWMLRLKKAGQTCEEFHERCAKNREIGRERLEKLANDPRASEPVIFYKLFPYPSEDLRSIHWSKRTLRASLKIWESRRRAHFDKVLYSYFQALLGNDCPMEAPIDIVDTPQRIVDAVEAEMVHCLEHFNRCEYSGGTDLASGSKANKELICEMIEEMYGSVYSLWDYGPNQQRESLTVTDFLKQNLRAIRVPGTSTVGNITRAYVDKIIALIETDLETGLRTQCNYTAPAVARCDPVTLGIADGCLDLIESKYKDERRCYFVVRRIAKTGLEPMDYLSWMLDASDKDSLLVYVRDLQWKQNQELRESYRIRQEMFYPGDSRPGFGWSVLWSWDQPKILEELSEVSMEELGWFYEESEDERYVQYQCRSAYLDESGSSDEVIIKVSMTKEVVGMYHPGGELLTPDS